MGRKNCSAIDLPTLNAVVVNEYFGDIVRNWLRIKPVWSADFKYIMYKIQPKAVKNCIRYKYGVKITNPYIYADKFTSRHCVGGKRGHRKARRIR